MNRLIRIDLFTFRYKWMSEEEFDSLRACLTDRCYCAEFVKGGLGGCPEIRLQCWEHADHTAGCPACILCDYLDSMDIKLWKWHLSRIECNLKKCAHDRVAHTCLSCECICGKCVKDFWVGCVCKDCVTEYQQPQEDDDDLPLTPPTSPSSPSRGVKRSHEETDTDQKREEPVFKKLEIPYPDELLDDAIINMKIIRPDDYDVDESDEDFCSAKNPDPEYEDTEPCMLASVEIWDEWRPFYMESYRPPLGLVFGHWAKQNTGLRVKPEAKLYTHEEARLLFCPLRMDEPDSAWTEDMGVSEMYEMALKCPCEEKTCVNILLRLRSCMRLKFEVDDAISALQ